MNDSTSLPAEALRRAIDRFWEAFPPFWAAIRAHIRETAAQRFDISVEQYHLLRHISKGQGSVSELAQAKHISRPAISQSVDALVHKGLIGRTTDLADRRHIRLALTEAGERLILAVSEETRQWMASQLGALSEDELGCLERAAEALKKIHLDHTR